ncbi:MAG TPA: zinc metalloprotease HtpX [Acidobacteriota bacterium]|nr:zinc metalloprotease HtpX [Acidobacteriota bacterium]
MSNYFRTALLLGLMTGLILVIGELLGGSQGLVLALGFAALLNFASYFYSDKIALAMYGAKQLQRDQAPEIFAIIENLVARAGIPMPRVYLIPSATPNAFATGRNPQHAAVAVTEGILRLLDREELKGVLAHELAHIKNRDILIASVAATMAGAIMMLARFAIFFPMGGRDDDNRGGALGLLLTVILAPIAALLIQMAISRSREYGADATGASMAGNPYGLANALRKLQEGNRRIPMEADPATSHMFIVKPFSGRSLMALFSTHPPVEKRIERLIGRRAI